ncbi:MAG: NAD(P)H-hydrate epimerase, partial [Bacteroidetes bacterium CG02_land_8_20_14_3_00_31_25]
MKLFFTKQIAKIDKFTIEHEPVSSIDLMERAANEIFKKIVEIYPLNTKFVIVSGSGNNGGDGLAVARLLYKARFSVKVFLLDISGKFSEDCKTNTERLKLLPNLEFSIVKNADSTSFKNDEVIIDAIFGSGLTRKVEGFVAEIINKINDSGCKIISIDIPSGLFGEDNSENNLQNIVKANYTLTLQFPKISFFFAENNIFVGNWYVLPIGLHKEIINTEPSNYSYVDNEFVKNIIHKRDKFSHKGSYGHALLIAGSKGKMGAAILASRACLRAGAGLLTTHVPKCGYKIIQTAIPEAMASIDE